MVHILYQFLIHAGIISYRGRIELELINLNPDFHTPNRPQNLKL